MIRLSDIDLTLPSTAGPVHILKGIDLAVAEGTSLSIVGPSGSGKSSLLAVMGGIERPSAGRVEIDGTELSALDEDGLARFRRDHLGILFQAFHLIPTMTAAENVALPLELAGRRNASPAAARLLEEVGLGHRARHYPGQLSGGEQQRVALARALANEPPVIIADEPTGNLDSDTGHDIIDLLFGVQRDRGATLVLVTHDPALAERCQAVRRMVDGRLEAPAATRPLAVG
ncbi:ABC transporter ATP-binding protein [Geminicoccaceae bacterium 1502E]|nr:ABC transporter ATP-binding protein [Geminicoccaceae bacterium 1502E]